MIEDATIVSVWQLDMEETVTVYLFLPPAQLVILPKTPTLIPGEAVAVLTVGFVTSAQPIAPPPPPPGLLLWANKGTETKVKQARAKTILIKRPGITNSPSSGLA